MRDRIIFVVLALIMVAACDQKPNPRVDWPPMDPSWGHAEPDAGLDGAR